MVLNLRTIYAPDQRNISITVRNHRDNHTMSFLPPQAVEKIDFSRWLDEGSKCTELNITTVYGRCATIYLEDSDWHLIVSGNIDDGRKSFKIGGDRDFDVHFTDAGIMRLTCANDTWGEGLPATLEFDLPPLQN
jgi:hypothetical protein